MKFLIKIKEFFLCLLRGKCENSIKKFLAYVFTVLAIYIAVFTVKDAMFVECLFMIGALLALRSYDKIKRNKIEDNEV